MLVREESRVDGSSTTNATTPRTITTIIAIASDDTFAHVYTNVRQMIEDGLGDADTRRGPLEFFNAAGAQHLPRTRHHREEDRPQPAPNQLRGWVGALPGGLTPKRTGPSACCRIVGRVYGWTKALNALILAYGDRITSNSIDHTTGPNTEFDALPKAALTAR